MTSLTRSIAFAWVLVFAFSIGRAEEVRDYYAEPGLNPFKDSINQHFNEHVDPFSGTLQLKYTDLTIPGNGGMDININRVYTSMQTGRYPVIGLNGIGWTMHFRCFAAGTTVLTDRGFVAIETLKVGDHVWAYDPDTGERAFKPIVKTFVNTKDTIWHLTLVKNGVSYRHEVTGSHPYFVTTVGWLEVAHLHVGAELLTEDGTAAVVTGVYDTGVVQPTYNLEVADINTYYVSAAKVLVHNCGGEASSRL